MKDVHETLLYIVYNLANQNLSSTIESINWNLGWIKREEFDIEEEITWLVMNGFLIRNDENEFELSDMGRSLSYNINRIRSKEDFNRLIDRSTNSRAYLDYCEEVYGYRMYLFNMMDRQQLDYLFNSIPVSSSDTVLDLGCGAGSILNHLAMKYRCHGFGIDQLNKAVVEKSSKIISYIDGDIDKLSDYNLKPSITLSIDSLYFSSDLSLLIKQLKSIKNNRLYLFYSQYIFDEKTEDKAVLHQDNTRIANNLQKNEIQYRVVDYSENEHSLYENALRTLPKYKNAFDREGNSDLYETKLRENRSGKEICDKGLAGRYLYIVE